MKKLFFLFAFMGLFAFVGTAQKKACCAAKASSEKTSMTSVSAEELDKALTADASIVKQVSNTGEVSFARKEVCATSGKVSFTGVEYCTKAGKFVNVSPSDAENTSCTKNASATKVSSKDKKACCAGGEKAGCCAKKGEKTSMTSTSNEGQVKLVNDQSNN